MNVADVLPVRIVTVAGTLAAEAPLVREIVNPPVGAAVPMVTVPVAFLPPATVAGLTVRAVIAGGFRVRLAVTESPLRDAVMAALDSDPTASVLAANVAEDLPAATVTDIGTVADLELLESLTIKPPVGAGPVRVTVPVELDPPVTTAGFIVIELREAGLIVRFADWAIAPSLPVMVTTFWKGTASVATLKLALA